MISNKNGFGLVTGNIIFDVIIVVILIFFVSPILGIIAFVFAIVWTVLFLKSSASYLENVLKEGLLIFLR